jgi:hypothetical protein
MYESSGAVNPNSVSDKYNDMAKTSTPTVGNSIEKYLIKEYTGKIGIFDESGILIKEINVVTVTLPLKERKKLNQGFLVNSIDDLEKFIEDYTG